MISDDERITLGDVAAAGFCRGGSRIHAKNLGIDFEDCERGELTAGRLRETEDPLAERVVSAAERRLSGEIAAAARNPSVIVTPADLRTIGYCKDGAGEMLTTCGLTWRDLMRGKITVAVLREVGSPETEMLALVAEARAAQTGG